VSLIDRLIHARINAKQISDYRRADLPRDIGCGYQLAATVVERLGWEPLGWKITGTTTEARQRLGVSHPIYGRTFRRFQRHSPVVFDHAALLDPTVECQIFVTLGADLGPRGRPWMHSDVLQSVATVHAGVEVAECRFPRTSIPSLPAFLADGSASGRYVYGGALAQWQTDLEAMEIALSIDGVPVSRRIGVDVAADLAGPLVWLAEERRRGGQALKAGEMISISCGAGPFSVAPGQTVAAVFGDHAHVKVLFNDVDAVPYQPD
jgi:2-keto-4-pentenoate hydratase